MVEKITKIYSLPKQWCDAMDIDPLLPDPTESVSGILTDGIWLTVINYARTPELRDKTNERLKADPNATLAKKKEITIHGEGLVIFLENYIKIHKVSPERTVMMFYECVHDSIGFIRKAQNLKEYKDALIHKCEDGAKAWEDIEERVKEIFNEYGVHFDRDDCTLKRNTANK